MMRIRNYIKPFYYSKFILFTAIIAGTNLIGSAFGADQSKNDTLAVIGDKIITSSDFVQSYQEKLRKVGLTDNNETRSKYLQNLADDELLISNAKQLGMDNTDSAKLELKRIRTQELLNTFALKYISTSVNVTESDLKDLFVKLNTKIKVSHLFAQTKEKADSLYNELIKGKNFEQLAKENFNDGQLKNNGGSLGYISLDEMDPDFEKAAYAMHPGEISKPVKTVEGYNIIRVEDIQGNPLLTENEFLKARERMQSFARKRAFEEASRQYAHSLSKELNTKFDDIMVSKVFDAISNSSLDVLIENPSSLSQADLNKTVVTSKLGKWNLKSLIDEMKIVTDNQKKFIRTKENLEDFISGLINREYILHKAHEEGMDRSNLFQNNVQFTFDTFLLTAIENKLKERIKINPDSIKSYYERNLNLYITGPEIRLSSILLESQLMADSIKRALENGAQFELLAQKFSAQAITGKNGGDMGYFKKEELGELSDKIFLLKIGESSGPFTEDGKFVFLKCTDYKKPKIKSLEESSDEIKNTLISYEWFSVRDKYVESLKPGSVYKLFTQKLYELKL